MSQLIRCRSFKSCLNDIKLSHKCRSVSKLCQTTDASTLKARQAQIFIVTETVMSARDADLNLIVVPQT